MIIAKTVSAMPGGEHPCRDHRANHLGSDSCPAQAKGNLGSQARTPHGGQARKVLRRHEVPDMGGGGGGGGLLKQ